ncbi:hypothetical protein B9T33_13850 [Acinetobacter sp. ANC 5054]|uniref:hypothetical protein n=1 Tax=Acinetobacter sp. ANC 5054 TaxID=1977877 RepID=UPI000A348B2F|nr:hypothetical protein [Acinetobacter sp. ANC 5054]OTG79043.1 hypothetical protein B9T33_13850 [Acinetobacter sp. ANC 5054]
MPVQIDNNVKPVTSFWPQWLKILSLLIALIVSPLYLYLMSLYGAVDGLLVLLTAFFLLFVTYYIVYLLLGFFVVGSATFWLMSRYPKHVQRIKVFLFCALALVWGIGILGFAFELIPYNSSTRTYF